MLMWGYKWSRNSSSLRELPKGGFSGQLSWLQRGSRGSVLVQQHRQGCAFTLSQSWL